MFIFQFTVIGEIGESGVFAIRHVEEDSLFARGTATILRHDIMAETVKEKIQRVCRVIFMNVKVFKFVLGFNCNHSLNLYCKHLF